MIITGEMIISGFVSKVVNDCGDILKSKIRDADKNRKSDGQTIETKIYQVIIDVLNVFLYNGYKKEEKVYDAAEIILKRFKSGEDNYREAVRAGLKIIVPQVTGSICEDFLEELCCEICREENRELAIGLKYSRNQPLRVCRALRSKILSLPCQVKSNAHYIRA